MTKEQLLSELGSLREELKTAAKADESQRRNLSKFLGSYKPSRYGGDRELVVLSWPTIYFRLGKKFDKAERMEDLTAIRSQLDHLMERQRERDQIENPLTPSP